MSHAKEDRTFAAQIDGKDVRVSQSFWRGENTSFHPFRTGMCEPDALLHHVLKGWMPEKPFIDRDKTIVAFGSCFARHLSGYLNNLNFDMGEKRSGKSYITAMGDGIVNSFAMRQQFEWAWEGKTPRVALWYGFKAEEFGYDEDVRLETKELFDQADVFIMTLGLSEIWYDEPTGEVFWRAVPKDRFDPARHKFRLASCSENKANIEAIYRMIRARRPEASVIFTLSPIPLAATFRDVSIFSANAASKASLKAAIDEFMIKHRSPDLFYFPSYELVLNCFRNAFEEDLRHPHRHIIELNMRTFERYFCRTGLTDDDVKAAYLDALAKDMAVETQADEEALKRFDEARTLWYAAHPAESLRLRGQQEARQAAIAGLKAEREARRAEREKRLKQREKRLGH